MTLRNSLLGRWKPAWEGIPFGAGSVARAKGVLESVLTASDQLAARAAEIDKDANLSAIGKNAAKKTFVGKATKVALNLADIELRAARADLNNWRARIQPTLAVDKTDVAAALLRSESRALLRGMTHAERAKLLLENGADQRLFDAVFEAPDFMSGVTPDVRSAMVERAIESKHPEHLASIAATEAAVELAEAAFKVVSDAARVAAEE